MSEVNGVNQTEKGGKVRRKREREGVSKHTFKASQRRPSGGLGDDKHQESSDLLQRRCACGAHTIAGGECDTCRQKREAGFLQRAAITVNAENALLRERDSVETHPWPKLGFGQDFSRIPVHSTQSSIVQKVDQRAGTEIPDADQQKRIGAELDPHAFVPASPPPKSSKSSVTPTAPPKRVEWDGLTKNPDHVKNRAALKKDLLAGLATFLAAQKSRVKKEKALGRVAMTRAGTGKLAGKDTGVQGIANAASNVLEKRFGLNMDAAVRTPDQLKTRKAPMDADPKSKDQNIFDAYSKASRKKALGGISDAEMAFGVVWWAMKHDSNCTPHTKTHHFSPGWRSSKEDWKFARKVLMEFVKKGTNKAELIDYRLHIWNETTDKGIMLLTTFDPATHGGDAKKAERATRWGIFSTAIHETVHFREHPTFEAAKRGRGTMSEGFTEMFAKDAADPALKKVRSGGDEPLREAVEGVVAPLDKSLIPAQKSVASKYLSDWNHAKAVRKAVGENAVRAAFFQGHVELLGLNPDGSDMTGLRAKGAKVKITKPAGVSNLAELATATGLTEAEIKAANPGITSALMPSMVLPGCREHIVVGTTDRKGVSAVEGRKHIATQHGVTEADLNRANPGIKVKAATGAWPKLTVGQKILIPKH